MALSPEERQILEYGKANGKSATEVKAAISKHRASGMATSTAPTASSTSLPTQDPNSAVSDIKTGLRGVVDAVGAGVNREVAHGQQGRGFLSRQYGRFTNGLQTVGGAIGALGEGVLRAAPGGTTVADTANKVVGGAIDMAGNTKVGQDIATGFDVVKDALPENVQHTISDTGAGLKGGLEIAGALTAPGVSSTVTRRLFKSVDDVVRSPAVRNFSVPAPRLGELVNKYRAQLSNIDPQVETILKQQSDPQKAFSYFDQAEKASIDPAVPMATKLAADRAIDAYTAMDKGVKEAGRLKSELLTSIEAVKIGGNIPGTAIDSVKKAVGERFGIEIDKTGKIGQVQGRMQSVDSKSAELVSKYVSMLRQLGPQPSARKLDDFVDAAQRMLYKQSSPNKFDVADAPVIALLKEQTGQINAQLKTNVDEALTRSGKEPQYAALNERYSSLMDVTENLSERLGNEGDKGASLMKSLFSPQTGEPTRRLFQQIKDETGIDLFEEATLAKFAMEMVGDTRSKTLLQEIDALAGDVSAVNLMEPGSWLNYIREKADLDGRDLAEEIIKQSNAAGKKSASASQQ